MNENQQSWLARSRIDRIEILTGLLTVDSGRLERDKRFTGLRPAEDRILCSAAWGPARSEKHKTGQKSHMGNEVTEQQAMFQRHGSDLSKTWMGLWVEFNGCDCIRKQWRLKR